MCGIAAIFSYHSDAPPVDREELLRIREHMTSRGPDGAGEWISENRTVGLAHRRLSIIDLSETGAQPMVDPKTGNVIVYNGEIYNYRELRSRLEAMGYRFRSSSDTEVLLHLYAEKGQEMVHDLRGMYAFAIYDSGKPSAFSLQPRAPGLFLVRDPFGIKPLYLADDGKTLRVASQVKALIAGGQVETAADPAGHVGFFLWGHVPEPYTMYKGIRALPAGSTLWVDAAGRKERQMFCSVSDELIKAEKASEPQGGAAAQEILREALRDSVRHHLVADVPVGVFLSAGIDSTSLAALAVEEGGNLQTVTLGFEEYRGTHDDEVPLAETVARHYGTRHQTVWVKGEAFRGEFDRLLEAMDQPTLDGVNSYFVSQAARKAGLKVAISGIGGDELFGGYPSFRQIPQLVRTVGAVSRIPGLGRGFRVVAGPLLKRFTSPKYAGLLEFGGTFGGAYLLRRGLFMPWELPAVLDVDLVREGWRELQPMLRLDETCKGIGNDHLRVSALEMGWYMRNQLLRDTDWASMAHSLEIRVPLVDLELLRAVAPLAASQRGLCKQDLASSPAKPLPHEVVGRAKTGFTVPVRKWVGRDHGAFERGLRGWTRMIYGSFC